jgi:hypothetical protein
MLLFCWSSHVSYLQVLPPRPVRGHYKFLVTSSRNKSGKYAAAAFVIRNLHKWPWRLLEYVLCISITVQFYNMFDQKYNYGRLEGSKG